LKETIFLNEEVKNLFSSGDPFPIAENIEGEVFRKTANRITKEFTFEGNRYFVKLHYGVGWKEILKNILKFRIPTIGASPEWKALKKLRTLGIECPEPVGFYSAGINPANLKSFLITKSLINTISLEEALKKGKFQKLNFFKKKEFIEKVATISRNLHDKGINHRDYYLCHFHVDKDLDVEKKIYLIDLHRAQLRSFVPGRWASKDIGGLVHSAMGFNLNEKDFYRFMRTYFQCSLKEALQAHSKFLRTSRNRAFRMFMKPILKEIDISLPQEQRENSDYLGGDKNNVRWIARKKNLPEGFEELISEVDTYMEQGEIIKDEAGHKIVQLNFKDETFIIKKYQIKGLWHYLRKLFSQTRALTAWKACHWFNAAGIRTLNIVSVIERYNKLTTTESYLISSFLPGDRLDEININEKQKYLIGNRVSSFFKRLQWIGFNHGDSKSSNFFLYQGKLFVFDLDVAKKRILSFQIKNKILKDQKRILKSFDTETNTRQALIKRFN